MADTERKLVRRTVVTEEYEEPNVEADDLTDEVELDEDNDAEAPDERRGERVKSAGRRR